MKTVTLGRSGIISPQNAFGALPIQRVSMKEAGRLLRRAYEGGFTFFDTANAYTDSEEKIGLALHDVRNHITLATKTAATDAATFWRHLNNSLRMLRTDHVDIYQFHNPSFCPKPGDGTGLYEAALEARSQGKIRYIGITNHRLAVAQEAVESGLYDTLQFPFCYLASEKDAALVELCRERHVGFIAMKGLSGGLITHAAAAYAWLAQFDNVLPIWGIQRPEELEEFLSFMTRPPVLDASLRAVIDADRKELVGSFCRSCGYCMPCPMGIDIRQCARMSQLIRRSPSESFLTPEWQAKMREIENCIHCNSCKAKCPYGLDIPTLLEKNLEDYKRILSGKESV